MRQGLVGVSAQVFRPAAVNVAGTTLKASAMSGLIRHWHFGSERRAQAGLVTTGHNIANASTPGFHRQQVVQIERDAASAPARDSSARASTSTRCARLQRLPRQRRRSRAPGAGELLRRLTARRSGRSTTCCPTRARAWRRSSRRSSQRCTTSRANPASVPSRQAMLSAAHVARGALPGARQPPHRDQQRRQRADRKHGLQRQRLRARDRGAQRAHHRRRRGPERSRRTTCSTSATSSSAELNELVGATAVHAARRQRHRSSIGNGPEPGRRRAGVSLGDRAVGRSARTRSTSPTRPGSASVAAGADRRSPAAASARCSRSARRADRRAEPARPHRRGPRGVVQRAAPARAGPRRRPGRQLLRDPHGRR